MEGHFPASREDLYHLQMEVKHVQSIQTNHADRLLRLEKRQADDAALKSVWTSPFPSVMGGGTPQHGPVQTPSADVFDDFDDEHGQNLIGSLHLDAEEEPVRRGASRANSVRFATNDVSAIHGWPGSRSSGEFGPLRPSSGIGGHPIERSSSHKSDGRHSSAGHSVHSVHSGRTSSLGLDTNFNIGGDDDDSPPEMPEPPPGLFILGSVPSIIRCWLDESFSNKALLYAVVCTGSQNSTLEHSLVKELGLTGGIHKSHNGASFIRLLVYLPEAMVTQPSSRANSPVPQLPSFTATFEVINSKVLSTSDRRKDIRVFIGSDTLRAHSADIFFSQNAMTLYGDDRHKLTVPFVRPEDETTFKNLRTSNSVTEKVELKATALEFKPSEMISITATNIEGAGKLSKYASSVSAPPTPGYRLASPRTVHLQPESTPEGGGLGLSGGVDDVGPTENSTSTVQSGQEQSTMEHDHKPSDRDNERRESSGIWGSWRSSGLSNNEADGNRESGSFSRKSGTSRSMKVLRPSKVVTGRSTSAARTGSSYEPPTPRLSGEGRRKSQGGPHDASSTSLRWDAKKGSPADEKTTKQMSIPTVSKSANPVGGASAFAWMNSGRSRTGTIGGD